MAAAADRMVADLRAAGLTIENVSIAVRGEMTATTSVVRLSVELRGREDSEQDDDSTRIEVTGKIGDVACDSHTLTPPAADMVTRMADAKAQADIGFPISQVAPPPSAPNGPTCKLPEKPRSEPEPLHKGPLSSDERALVRDMLEKGATGKDIAARLNRDPRQLGGVIGAMRKQPRKRVLTPPAPKAAASPAPRPDPEPPRSAPAAAPVAEPPRAAAPRSDAGPDNTTSARLRDLRQRLDALDGVDGWNAQRDVALIGSLFMGEGLDAATVASGAASRADARARFDALCPDKTIAAQQDLFRELKRRAGDAEEAS
ncbi:helix-turn-helix domain-containing protein [Meridianimarinicoccus sp. RP-17]|uniref:helix-turn-helix domain-containing protein n=1 Tax=Meridianimarinicoccus zhengii TaxID=2056810 RepID=UPI0013A69C31|nr:helix-turn-helix domain-containing protein [Phycocomes zhengii]